MTRMLVSRFLLLLITLGTAALLASYVGVEKEDRWRMDGTVYEISAFPAGEAWPMIRTSLTGPDSGSAATSTSPHVTALAGRPALDVLPDGVAPTAVVASTSPFVARAAAGRAARVTRSGRASCTGVRRRGCVPGRRVPAPDVRGRS